MNARDVALRRERWGQRAMVCGLSAILRGWPHMLCTLTIELSPYLVGRFADPGFLNQLPRHRGHQVLIRVERLQTFAGELALHHECHKHLSAHETQADFLHRFLVSKELHSHRMSLP